MAAMAAADRTASVRFVSPFVTDRHWRKLAGICLLASWAGWMVATPAAMRPAVPTVASLPTKATLTTLHDQLPPGTDTSAPLAIRLPGACACPGDDARWNQLSQAMAQQHGTSVALDVPVAQLAGHDVVILDAEGELRYAGPLQPDPSLCGGAGSLARWLPALLADSSPLALARPCSC